VASSESLQVQGVKVQGQEILCDVSTGVIRPLVPEVVRKKVFTAIHGLAHPGTRATCSLVAARYVWRGCSADVTGWRKEGMGCACGMTLQHLKMKVEPIPVPRARFQNAQNGSFLLQ
jgi:Integrase zinc binding domain